MINKKLRKWISVSLVLIALWGITSCGGKKAEEDSAPSRPKVTKISFKETFGETFEVEIIATEEKIWYNCFKQDIVSGGEPEVINRRFGCGQETWNHDLYLVFADNYVELWKPQEYYLNRLFDQEADGLFEEPLEVRYARTGDFFNIAGENPDFTRARYPRYYGIDANEKNFRSSYRSRMEIYIDEEENPCLEINYGPYGLPREYHEFQKDFWRLIVGWTGIGDWRHELDQWGRETLYSRYPYMRPDGQDRKIRYFSLLESYGGKDQALAASLVYDGGTQSLQYEFGCLEETYSVGKSGRPVLYCEKQLVDGVVPDKKIKAEKAVPEIPEGLTELLEKYQVDMWETDPGGTTSVRQGEFYDTENAKQAEDKNEQALRSGYDTLIHVVYTNGDHTEIRLENGKLPEAYNDFRDELWDLGISCVNEGRMGNDQTEDWRDFIDEWGQEYMYARYPYMK